MDPISAGIGLATLAGGVYDSYLQSETARKNLKFQEENLDYLKATQKETWRREDTSSQRKMADLKAAGLNPILASGMQAQSSAPIRTEAPQLQQIKPGASIAQGGIEAMNIMGMKANIEKTFAETQRIKAEADFLQKSNPIKLEELESKQPYFRENALSAAYQLRKEAQASEWKTLEAQYDQKIKYYKIGTAEQENILSQIKNDIAMKDLSIKEQELLAKKIAVEQAQHNLDKYKMFGIPSNYQGGITKDLLGVGWLAQEAINKAQGGN